MRVRLELFVDDLAGSIAFYTEVLGFEVVRCTDRYASLRRGRVVLGLGPVGKLPARVTGPGFTQDRLRANRGAGVEIVLELDSVTELTELHDRCRYQGLVVEPLQDRPWGLRDFRLVDPDGFYLRITHGDATT